MKWKFNTSDGIYRDVYIKRWSRSIFTFAKWPKEKIQCKTATIEKHLVAFNGNISTECHRTGSQQLAEGDSGYLLSTIGSNYFYFYRFYLLYSINFQVRLLLCILFNTLFFFCVLVTFAKDRGLCCLPWPRNSFHESFSLLRASAIASYQEICTTLYIG